MGGTRGSRAAGCVLHVEDESYTSSSSSMRPITRQLPKLVAKRYIGTLPKAKMSKHAPFSGKSAIAKGQWWSRTDRISCQWEQRYKPVDPTITANKCKQVAVQHLNQNPLMRVRSRHSSFSYSKSPKPDWKPGQKQENTVRYLSSHSPQAHDTQIQTLNTA